MGREVAVDCGILKGDKVLLLKRPTTRTTDTGGFDHRKILEGTRCLLRLRQA